MPIVPSGPGGLAPSEIPGGAAPAPRSEPPAPKAPAPEPKAAAPEPKVEPKAPAAEPKGLASGHARKKALQSDPTETTPPHTAGTPAAQAKDGEGSGAAVVYEPKVKTYKVKGQEQPIPDYLLSVIKDEKTEQEVRDMLQKHGGFDHVYTDRANLQKQIAEHYAPMEEVVQQLVHFKESGDLDSFFEAAGLARKDVLSWALQFAQMKPEEIQARDQARQQQFQVQQAQVQAQTQTQALQQQLVQARSREVDFVLSRSEYQQAELAFDTRFGKPGAFREEVWRRGKLHADMGVELTAEQAVQEVMKYAGLAGAQPGPAIAPPSQAAQPPAPGVSGGAAQPPQRKPVIPSVSGGGVSPAKKVIRSRDDLRARRRELEAQGR